MSDTQHAAILAIVGLPGAGKSEAVEYICSKGFPKVYFGGVILDAMKEQGIEWTEDNEKSFREGVREREGKDFVVKRIIEQLHHLIDAGQHRIVADGLYSWDEYKIMKHEFPGELVVAAVVAPKHLRHHRLAKRPIRPLTGEEANKRDWAQIENLSQGGPIAVADYFVHNDASMETFYRQIDDILAAANFLP